MTRVDDMVSIPVDLPVDSAGFLRRECPTCEQQFKWFSHAEGDPSAEPATQYFCPLCGVAAGTDAWWTTEQLEYARGAAGPEIDRVVQDLVTDAFRGSKHISYRPDPTFTFGIATPEPLIEPDDMVIVEPPCHPNEPLKVPEHASVRVHCLICGELFAT